MKHYSVFFVFMVLQAIKCEKAVLKSSKNVQFNRNCLEPKCDLENNPQCVRIKRYDMTPTYHVITANDCELHYLQCNNDVKSKIVSMKHCTSSRDDELTAETNRTKSGSVHIRVKRSVVQPKPTLKPKLPKVKQIQRKLKPNLHKNYSKVKKIKPNLLKNNQRLRKVKPKLRKDKPKLQKIKPKLRKVKSKLRKIKPNQQKVKPKLRKVRPNRLKHYSKMQKIKPKLLKNKQKLRLVNPKLRKAKRNQQNVKPKLRKVKPNLQKIKPNVRKAFQHETSNKNITRHHKLKTSRSHRKKQRLRANSKFPKVKGKRLRTKHFEDLGKHARQSYALPFSTETDSDFEHNEFKRLKLGLSGSVVSEDEGGMTGKSGKMQPKAFAKMKNYKMAQLKFNKYTYLNTEGLTPAPMPLFALYSAESHKDLGKVDMEQYDDPCPKVCPARDRMVCARCQHGIYRSFSSVCHLRMFSCKHPEEVMTLVFFNPCLLSSPFLSESGMQPQGRLERTEDDDVVIRFIKCREEGLLSPTPAMRQKAIKRVALRTKGSQQKHRPAKRTIEKVYGYNYINKFNTWHDAKFVCDHSDALLFYPRTKKEAESIYNQFAKIKEVKNPKHPYSIFVGIYLGVSKDYVTIDGKPISEVYANWAQGEPDHNNDNKYCVAMNSRYEYHAVDCNERLTFICKRPIDNRSKLRTDSKEKLFVDVMERIFGDGGVEDNFEEIMEYITHIDEDSTETEDSGEDESGDYEDNFKHKTESSPEVNLEDESNDVVDKPESSPEVNDEDGTENDVVDEPKSSPEVIVEDGTEDDVKNKTDSSPEVIVEDGTEEDVKNKTESSPEVNDKDESEDDVKNNTESSPEVIVEDGTEEDVKNKTESSPEVNDKDESDDDNVDESESSAEVNDDDESGDYVEDDSGDYVETDSEGDSDDYFGNIFGNIIKSIIESSSNYSTEGTGEENNLDEVGDRKENDDDNKDKIHYYSSDPRCNFESYKEFLHGKFFDYKGSAIPLDEQLYKKQKSDSEY
ncbi:hypothetical protein PYW07_012563 [Mythimna separata]|uniref:C-type lectin domain-containing protein n=1 Tax=Mythimna separata TaxID=271217 RepID=A0AAD7Y8H0_MYTSE|nr:hypothetical protein PYW07_012563 [Mythimna separata]